MSPVYTPSCSGERLRDRRFRSRPTAHTFRQPGVRLALLALAVLFGGCGAETDEDGAIVLADPALVPIVADVHIADARAETTGEPLDSLHQDALARHGLDSAAYAARLGAAMRTPDAAAAFYDAVTEHLTSTVVDASPDP